MMNFKNYAWVTLVTKTTYEVSAGRLYQSLQYFKSKYPMVIMVTDNLTEKDLPFLTKNNIPYVKVPLLQFSNFKTNNIYNDTLSKFNCLALTDYDYICFIDADILILENIDFIFENIDIYKNFNLYYLDLHSKLIGNSYSGAVALMKPDIYLFNSISNKYNKTNIILKDETILNSLDQNLIKTVVINTGIDLYLPILHFVGSVKLWELFKLIPHLNEWFYNSDIEIFINKLLLEKDFLYLCISKCLN